MAERDRCAMTDRSRSDLQTHQIDPELPLPLSPERPQDLRKLQ
jgi:hypothetical protein